MAYLCRLGEIRCDAMEAMHPGDGRAVERVGQCIQDYILDNIQAKMLAKVYIEKRSRLRTRLDAAVRSAAGRSAQRTPVGFAAAPESPGLAGTSSSWRYDPMAGGRKRSSRPSREENHIADELTVKSQELTQIEERYYNQEKEVDKRFLTRLLSDLRKVQAALDDTHVSGLTPAHRGIKRTLNGRLEKLETSIRGSLDAVDPAGASARNALEEAERTRLAKLTREATSHPTE